MSLRFVLSRVCVFLYSLGPQCSHKTWLSRNVCKTKTNLNLLEKLELIKDSKAKCLRNVTSKFGISGGAVNNTLKKKREY